MTSDVQSASVSAQSPPWRRKRFPACASATTAFSFSTSHDVTSGGSDFSFPSALASAAESSYATSCAYGLSFHESTVQTTGPTLYQRSLFTSSIAERMCRSANTRVLHRPRPHRDGQARWFHQECARGLRPRLVHA